MLKINNKGKLIIGLLAFVLITPLLVFYTLENSNIFDIRSSARSATLTDELKKADLNSDNVVSLTDFSLWLGYYKEYKESATYKQAADLDGNGTVGLADYAEWLRLFRLYKEWVKESIDSDNPVSQVGYVGTGKDGDINVTQDLGNMNINTNKLIALEGRATSCPDAPQYNVESFGSDGKSVIVDVAIETACLKPGDEVMLINLQGTAASVNNVGNYESLIVSSVSSKTINFTTAKKKHYGVNANDDTGIGLTLTSQRVMVQRVPNYKNVTIASGGVLTGSGFDGKKGGVLFFRASGTVNIGGTITMTGKGYHGGAGSSGFEVYSAPGQTLYADSSQSGYGGTTTIRTKLPGAWLNDNITSPSMLDGKNGTYSGGGGAATWGTGGGDPGIPSNVAIIGNAGAGNSSSTVSGGGGGGGSATGAKFLAYNFWRSGRGGGGGGGGYGTGGYGGSNGNGVNTTDGRLKNVYCNLGENGSAAGSGRGGSAKYLYASYTNGDGYVDQGYYVDGYGGAGGGGSADYGTAGLTQIFLGSGGGGGGAGFLCKDQNVLAGGAGGAGGGIILISAKNITVPGSLASNGGNGANGVEGACGGGANTGWAASGGGGAGSGGSIRLEGDTISVGSSKVTAVGGQGGKEHAFCGGGDGGSGRIAVYSADFSGTTNPTAQSSN